MNYNKLILGGRLVKDPELRVLPTGTAITSFTVATSRKFKGGDGADREEVAFVDCEAWAKTGEAIAKHFTKGKAIFVEGRIKQDTWEDKTTHEKRSKLKMSVDSFQFVGSKEDGVQRPQEPASQPRYAEQKPQENGSNPDLDESLPF